MYLFNVLFANHILIKISFVSLSIKRAANIGVLIAKDLKSFTAQLKGITHALQATGQVFQDNHAVPKIQKSELILFIKPYRS